MKPQKTLHLHLEMAKRTPKHIGCEYMIFEKHDGWYGYLDIGQGIASSAAREIPSMRDLSRRINMEAHACPYGRLIFEIMIKGTTEFKDLNGLLNRHETASNAYILVHDFIEKNTNEKFRYRIKQAMEVVRQIDMPEVQLANILVFNSKGTKNNDAWWMYAESMWSQGKEGIIAKRVEATYSPGKRNYDILKMKMESTEEMRVTGMEAGEGKYHNTLGKLKVVDVHGVEHSVSGMSDHERDLWWNSPTTIAHHIVEVQFMKRLANGSLREPRYKAIRYDKKELG